MHAFSGEDREMYLRPTGFVDCDNAAVVAFAKESAGSGSETQKAVSLFYAVRDGIRYDPYRIDLTEEALRASVVLEKGYGYCVAKALLLAAAARAVGIPSRLRFADIRNHLTPPRLKEVMKTDFFAGHGYTEMFLGNQWVKATPAFNLAMCQKLEIVPVEFDGINDATFPACDAKGNRHIEYLSDYGSFADLPFSMVYDSFRKHYPMYFSEEKDAFIAALENETRQNKRTDKTM
jgi:transglutaminase-like putative cysteine protease